MILVRIELLKQGPNASRIRVNDKVLTISNSCIVVRDEEYFVTCSDTPVPGSKEITVDSDLIFNKDYYE